MDYNEAAIKFYERNSFTTLRTEYDHYVIKEQKYNAIILYKMIDKDRILLESAVEDGEQDESIDNMIAE